jgi:plasmid stabilization system protein ParE
MRFRVVVTIEAERDLDAVFRAVSQDSPANAKAFVDGLRSRLGSLATMPRRCPRAPEDGRGGLEIRHLIHAAYRIIFAIDGRTVAVLQVRHGARLANRRG